MEKFQSLEEKEENIKNLSRSPPFSLLSPLYRWVKVEGLAGSRLHSQVGGRLRSL